MAACDLYVGIFAHRYGYVPEHDNPDRRSITELEYRHAQAHGIPRLLFLLDPATLWAPAWMDAHTGDGDQGGRIRALREELGHERLLSFFATADQLAQLVSVAVTKQLAASSTPTMWSKGCQQSQPGGRGRSRRRCVRLPAVTSSSPPCAHG